jgi:hypothetical protein
MGTLVPIFFGQAMLNTPGAFESINGLAAEFRCVADIQSE